MYCTQGDLEERYGEDELIQLTDRSVPHSGVVDAAVVARACTDASAVIDSYCRSAYAIPLSAANAAVVKPYACLIARWLLHEDAHPEHVEHGYDAAIRWLRDLAAGKVGLPDLSQPDDGSGPDPDGGGAAFGIAVAAPKVVFTNATLARQPTDLGA